MVKLRHTHTCRWTFISHSTGPIIEVAARGGARALTHDGARGLCVLRLNDPQGLRQKRLLYVVRSTVKVPGALGEGDMFEVLHLALLRHVRGQEEAVGEISHGPSTIWMMDDGSS